MNDIPIVNVNGLIWHYVKQNEPFCSVSGCTEKATRKAYILSLLNGDDQEGYWLNAYLCEEHYKEKVKEDQCNTSAE